MRDRLILMHAFNLRWRQEMWSRVLDLACGFWSISEGKVMAALSAIPSMSDSKAKALKKNE